MPTQDTDITSDYLEKYGNYKKKKIQGIKKKKNRYRDPYQHYP